MTDSVRQSIEDTLLSQVNQLKQLDASSSHHLEHYRLQAIFGTLHYEYETFRDRQYDFDPHELGMLAEKCLQVVDSAVSDSKIKNQSRVLAMKILILVARQPNFQLYCQETSRMIYESLIHKLQLPQPETNTGFDQTCIDVIALAAHCLSKLDYAKILSPEKASRLITNSILPLAVQCLRAESRQDRGTYDRFENDFHGLYDHIDLSKSQPEYIYPRVIRLLLALVNYSDLGLKGYLAKFESMLNVAIGRGSTNDEDIVALNVLVIYRDTIPFEPFVYISMDLLSKSKGLHRAHVAYLKSKCFLENHITGDETKEDFVRVMIEEFATNNDDLLDEIALETTYDLQFDIGGWNELVEGKEIQIISKLIERKFCIGDYLMLLRGFRCLEDDESSYEFGYLTLTPISQNINKFHQLMAIRKERYFSRSDLEYCIECLTRFVRLRKHRLTKALELRLNQIFEILVEEEISPLDANYFIFANSFQVNPKAWQSIIRLTRFTMSIELPSEYCAWSEKCLLDRHGITMAAWSHLLLIDAHHFYSEIGSLDTIELLYTYCKKAVESGLVTTLLKEILLTWPRDHEKTTLDSDGHRSMLSKFIKLLITGFENATKNSPAPRDHPDRREEDKMSEFLFGLAAAFSLHRDALLSVLDELKAELELGDRDSWLKDKLSKWTKLILGDEEDRLNLNELHYYEDELRVGSGTATRLDEFANVVVASEAMMAICTEDPNAYPALRESFGAMMEVVKAALERGIKRAPVDSIESKRYRHLHANLAAIVGLPEL